MESKMCQTLTTSDCIVVNAATYCGYFACNKSAWRSSYGQAIKLPITFVHYTYIIKRNECLMSPSFTELPKCYIYCAFWRTAVRCD